MKVSISILSQLLQVSNPDEANKIISRYSLEKGINIKKISNKEAIFAS